MFHCHTRTPRTILGSRWADEETIDVISVLHLPRFATLGLDRWSCSFRLTDDNASYRITG